MKLPKKIGIVAGNGDLPILIADEARKAGSRVFAVGFEGITGRDMGKHADSYKEVKFGMLRQVIDCLKKAGVEKVLIAGLIKHDSVFNPSDFDETARKMFASLKDLRADSILGAIAGLFSREKLEIISSLDILKGHLAGAGVLSSAKPSAETLETIRFGQGAARHVAGYDIGQAVIVKDRSVVAVEAMEGTDECIRRAGKIAGRGTVVVKVSKPGQDWRFDIPVIGVNTIASMVEAGSTALAIEAGKTIMINKPGIFAGADAAGIVLYGMNTPGFGSSRIQKLNLTEGSLIKLTGGRLKKGIFR